MKFVHILSFNPIPPPSRTQVIHNVFDSEEHSPSVFELAIDSSAATFLNTPRARRQVND